MAASKRISGLLIRSISLAGVGLLSAAGCVENRHETVVRREYEPAETEVVTETYYEPAPVEVITTYEPELNPHGRWVQTHEYGKCWVPRERPPGWRPYTIGHWVNSPEGWCWVAEDREAEWGQITYHYGRWYEDRSNGWVWVPGTTYAPAWVAWREGNGYCGWAPLPPDAGYGRNVSRVRVERVVPADRYVYVEERHMDQPRVHDHVVQNNTTIINNTTNITNITVVNNKVVNQGVSVTNVEKYSGRRVQRVEVEQVTSAEEARRLRVQGRAVAFVPPTVQKADTQYRERVERREAEQRTAMHDRAQGRAAEADAAKKAEKDRVTRRENDAKLAEQQERERVAARAKAAEDARKMEHDRAVAREKEAEAAKLKERERAAARAKEAEAAEKAERERVARRAKEAAAAKEMERDKLARDRAAVDQPSPTETKEQQRERAIRREKEAEAARLAERERIARRNRAASQPAADTGPGK